MISPRTAAAASASGATSGSASGISVAVSPSAVNLMPGQSQQLVATETGSSDNEVIWEVNGVQGGSSAAGTVSATGLYQAPSAVPTGGAVSVTAVSVDDNTQSATAVISIADNVTINPLSAGITSGATQQFTATLNGSASTAVTWSVAGVTGGGAATGTISTTGLYTAPSTVPSSTVTVTAVDASDSLASASAQITVTENPAIASAQNGWLAGAAQAALNYGCTSVAVQQQPTETVTQAISLFVQTAQEGSCLVLSPISTNVSTQTYSYAWGGNVNGIDIWYMSDVNEMRIWNGVDVTGQP
ncbi:hypothetical protein HNQ77_003139 [Silvibacterium bohemicum]|uniref:BIG2 domain-containing protein n=1 Tax=Silvibacterium bohemicum TaxID=1577686 RepID=A0A841K1Y0_9BACT|nr:hypothetical protein [Silvibacterium bohemicum]MBB6145181.1 hypothetical protein [Silvibacterium bohemicum]